LPVQAGPLLLGGWHVVHGDGALPDAPIVQGHFHPCLRIRGMRLSAPCYLVAERRLILPAYSAEAAGVDVLGRSEWDGFRCHVIAGDHVLDFGDLASLKRKWINPCLSDLFRPV
jgi:metallophosphoesterase superfamily enzyme